MRCRLTNPCERAVLALLSVPLLALCVLPSLASAQIEVLDQVVAIVDDDIILASELQERVQGVRSTMESRGVEVPSDDVLIRETLDRLILDSIQLQLANRYGVRIPDQQLDEAMTRLARQNGLTLEQFRIALEQSGQSYAAAREGLRDDLAIQRVQQGNVMRNINISEQEIDNFLTTEEGEAMTQPEYQVVQALLSISRGEDAAEIAAKEAYVDEVLSNIQSGQPFEQAVSGTEPYAFTGGDLGWRKLGDLPSMFADTVPTLTVGEVTSVRSSSGLHLVYLADAVGGEQLVRQTDVRHILVKPTEVLDEQAAEDLVVELRARIEGGEDFGELARQYSDDIGSATEGGNLGWTNPGQMVPEFEATMAGTAEGLISQPFRSEFGWHILEVKARRDKDFSGEVRRNQVAGYIRDQKYQEELDAWLRKIREEAFVDIK
ncbi:MAG: chaperone SurA [Gammaproteobacteria bacterium]|nr:MAG: chaperone SurA [Gammaproteobacteria bacterium]